MRLMACLIIAGALAAGCSPQISCNAEGMIIIQPDAPSKTRADWRDRNMALALERLDRENGMQGDGSSVVKAVGCP